MNKLARTLAACSLVFMLMFPSIAVAETGTGEASASEPVTAITPGDAHDQEYVEHEQQDIDGVVVSATGDSALIEGASFGLKDFERAAAGSNKSIDGAYHGYNYYIGTEPENVSVVSVDNEYAVIYIPQSACTKYSLNLKDADDQKLLQQYLIALDQQNARGSSRLETVPRFYFTSDNTYTVNHITFSFDKEVTDGRYYVCVIGEDGSDITAASNPYAAQMNFADFARIVPPSEIDIVLEKTGFAWLADFLARIDYSPLWVTLKTTLTAIVIIFVLGLAAAYLTLRVSKRVQDILDTIFTIPMVLPPTVCGFILLLICGRNTAFGRFFIDIGFPLIFSWQATVLAAVVVAFPLMYRNARGALENLDPNMLDAARTLGWSNARIFLRLMLPLSWSSIAAGTVLAFARALGEFGATLFLAGNYIGITRTIPIAIYFEWMNGSTDVAIFWTIVVIAFSFLVILFINLWSRRTTRYRKGAIEE